MAAILAWSLWTATFSATQRQPNIVFILADDLGWNDVGWNNPDIKTPNLDALAYDGVIFNNSYVQPVCSPSRAALLTGRYPFKMGFQHGALRRQKPYGLPLQYSILPQKLRDLGYSTHIAGKWHLGFCRWAYTPTYRGFDSFMGFYTGGVDYYNHKTQKERGYDFRLNRKVFRKARGIYSTELLAKRAQRLIQQHDSRKPFFLYLPFQAVHIPLQVPRKYERHYPHIKNNERRIFSGMVTALDTAVGRVLSALMAKHMMDNTLIIFTSDNGGSVHDGGNNWPLRGGKSTLWEGGTRVPTFVWGKMLRNTSYVNNEIIHATDWYPTLLRAAGGQESGTDLDGIDQLGTISLGLPTNRTEFVYNIDDASGRAAIRVGDYKLIQGTAGRFNGRYQPQTHGKRLVKIKREPPGRHFNQTMLFNIKDDPTESYDLSTKLPEVVKQLKKRLKAYKSELVPSINPRKVRKAHPKFWGRVWSPGWC